MLVNMNSILKDAQKNKYGVDLFNVIDTDGLQAAIAAAEELRSPIIIGTAEVLLPYGDLHIIGPGMIEMANIMKLYKKCNINVPVRVDHVPLMAGEKQDIAGYTALGRLYAIGY